MKSFIKRVQYSTLVPIETRMMYSFQEPLNDIDLDSIGIEYDSEIEKDRPKSKTQNCLQFQNENFVMNDEQSGHGNDENILFKRNLNAPLSSDVNSIHKIRAKTHNAAMKPSGNGSKSADFKSRVDCIHFQPIVLIRRLDCIPGITRFFISQQLFQGNFGKFSLISPIAQR